MTTIYSINADRQERYDTVRPENVGKAINILKRKGQLKVQVIPEMPQFAGTMEALDKIKVIKK